METDSALMAGWWKDLGRPELNQRLKQTIIDGTLEQAGGRSVEQLARERDEMVLGLIRLRRKAAQAPTSQATSVRSRTKA
jgi:carnitine 3-dehydrogenase